MWTSKHATYLETRFRSEAICRQSVSAKTASIHGDSQSGRVCATVLPDTKWAAVGFAARAGEPRPDDRIHAPATCLSTECARRGRHADRIHRHRSRFANHLRVMGI